MPQKVVSKKLAKAINNLHAKLAEEFGTDFAYTILGKGFTLAEYDVLDGHVKPLVEMTKPTKPTKPTQKELRESAKKYLTATSKKYLTATRGY